MVSVVSVSNHLILYSIPWRSRRVTQVSEAAEGKERMWEQEGKDAKAMLVEKYEVFFFLCTYEYKFIYIWI